MRKQDKGKVAQALAKNKLIDWIYTVGRILSWAIIALLCLVLWD